MLHRKPPCDAIVLVISRLPWSPVTCTEDAHLETCRQMCPNLFVSKPVCGTASPLLFSPSFTQQPCQLVGEYAFFPSDQ